MEERIFKRIKKLLSLAENNSSPNEAQQAIAKAQTMAYELGWSLEDFQNTESLERNIIEKIFIDPTHPRRKYIPTWQVLLMQIIVPKFRCGSYSKGVVEDGQYRRQIILVGLKQDVGLSEEALRLAFITYERERIEYIKHWHREKKEKGEEVWRQETEYAKNDFLYGFTEGISEAFREQAKGNDIILASYFEEIQAYMRKIYGDVKKAKNTGLKIAGEKENIAKGKHVGKKTFETHQVSGKTKTPAGSCEGW